MIKIAFATDDLITIRAHLGRAQKFLVYTIQDGHVIAKEERVKPAHDHSHHEGHDHNDGHFHNSMVEAVKDCQIVIARGMGRPAFDSVERAGAASHCHGALHDRRSSASLSRWQPAAFPQPHSSARRALKYIITET